MTKLISISLLLLSLLYACQRAKPKTEPKANHSTQSDPDPHTSPHISKHTSQPGHNTDPSFVGIQGMKDALRNMPGSGNGNLTKFRAWAAAGQWDQFGPEHHHYDWWMFPIDRKTSGQGMKYTVYKEDIEALKKEAAWLQDYREGATLLMQSWGWHVQNKCPYPKPAAGQRWRHHDVRLGKLANSLILFGQHDLYHSLHAYVNHLKTKGITLQAWVLEYFP